MPEDALAPGDFATLRVWQKTFKQGFVIYGELWLESETKYGEVVVPVGGAQ